MDHNDRIEEIRLLLGEMETALASFGRRSEERFTPVDRRGNRLATPMKVPQMIRYADEVSFAGVCANLAKIRVALNSLPADIDDAMEAMDETIADLQNDIEGNEQ